MRLILAPTSMEGIKEKLLKSQERKFWQKILWKSRKRKMGRHLKRHDFNHKDQLYCTKSSIYMVWKLPKRPPTLWKIGRNSLTISRPLLFSWNTPTPLKMKSKPKGSGRETPLPPAHWSIYNGNQRLKCPCGLKQEKWLFWGSLVRRSP
jgi:hypothetical protein